MKEKKWFGSRRLCFSAISIALSFVLSMIKLFTAPEGGTVTLMSMFFICITGYFFGLKAGLASGLVFGILELIVDPFILSIPQVILDYFLAFGSLGLSGLFRDSKHGLIKGYLTGITARCLFTTVSGVIFFADYGGTSGAALWLYSFIYNASYIYIEGGITVALLLLPPVSDAISKMKSFANEENRP